MVSRVELCCGNEWKVMRLIVKYFDINVNKQLNLAITY